MFGVKLIEVVQRLCTFAGQALTVDAENWMAHRGAAWVQHPFGLWDDPADDERGKAWVRSAVADMQPFATGAVYLNFIGNEGEDRVRAAYGDDYDRLAAMKAEFDPDNVFHLHHPITPLAAV